MNGIEFQKQLEAEFADYLKELGYPDGSLLFEPNIEIEDKLYRPDFLIIDPEKNERLAIVEVRGKLQDASKYFKEKLNKYRNVMAADSIPIFLAVPSEEYASKHTFDLFRFKEDDKFEKIDLRLFPTFSALSSNKVAGQKKEIPDKQEKATSKFEIISLSVAAILILIVIADFICSIYGITVLTVERLSLLGGAVALIVIPYAQKIKGLGIEWEKATTKNRNDS